LCLRLWSIEEERGRAAQRPPEIEEADLAPLALELAVWGVRDPGTLRLPTPPPPGPFTAARKLLAELGALDPDGAVTAHGRAMAELPLHPRLAHMLLCARTHGMTATALAAAALAGTREIGRGDADLTRRLAELGLGEVPRVRRQLARLLGQPLGEPDPAQLGAVLSLAFPDRLAQARPGSRGAYRLANGRGARLDATDPLAGEAWLAVAELDDAGAEARIRAAAPVAQAQLETLHRERIVSVEEVRFEPREEAVVARRAIRLGALTLREQALTPDPAALGEAMCTGIRWRGLGCLPWNESARQLQARVALLRRREPEVWPDLADDALLAGLEEWLAPYLGNLRRLADLCDLDLAAILADRLTHAQRRDLARRAPERLTVPSGRAHGIDYTVDPPVLGVKLQEMFGLVVTPAVDEGRVPLVLHLLSPARRPLAVTRDLAGFWTSGYPAVRKEMRGRYPKHPWPEEPMAAPATHRAAQGSRSR
jgi:ATP-dependent helicase HrpB